MKFKNFVIKVLAVTAIIEIILFAGSIVDNIFLTTPDLGKGDPSIELFTCGGWNNYVGCNITEYLQQYIFWNLLLLPFVFIISAGILFIIELIKIFLKELFKG